MHLDRSTLAKWLGRVAHELTPVYECLKADLRQSTKLFMEETTAPVLDRGRGKPKTGYFWALARDDRPWGGSAPPGVVFTYAPSRAGKHAVEILQGFGGVLQVDGYTRYNRVKDGCDNTPIELAYCWAHARRKLFELTINNVAPSPRRASSRSKPSTALKRRSKACLLMNAAPFVKRKRCRA